MTDLLDRAAEGHSSDPATASAPAPMPRLARILGTVGRAMIIAGIVVLLFVVFQLYGTDIQEARAQDDLATELDDRFDVRDREFDPSLFARPVTTEPAPVAVETPDADDTDTDGTDTDDTEAEIADEPLLGNEIPQPTIPPDVDDDLLALLFPDEGDALAQIEIPSIDVDKVVVRGVAVADLRRGPGHYSQTALPGNPGNSSIAGHRTTYGSPFNRIDELVPGDEITVTSIQGEFTYRVMDPTTAYADELPQVLEVGAGHIIVAPSATWVLGDFGDDRVTLTACHPKLSSRQRIIVAAELVDDAVEIPEWIIAAEAERQAVDGSPPEPDDPVIAADDPSVTEPVETPGSDPVDITTASDRSSPDLDEGLSGERDAIPAAAAWMGGAILLWYLGGWAGRRRGGSRLQGFAWRLAGLLPALVCLWFSFELIDRALPAV